MNKNHKSILILVVFGVLFLLFSCKPEPDEETLYVNLTWHQHQPMYYIDTDGVFTRPWVRVHATKDYLDMVQKVAEYKDIHVTFNLTPSLIRQLNDFTSGAKDKYWVLAEKPVSELTELEKIFILERFFDVNWNNIIANYPRYQELLDKRGGSDESSIQAALSNFSDQDILDLQIWFNLAWFDPVFLAEEPLASLVKKGEGFSQGDKGIVFSQVEKILDEVIPYHKMLQDKGQIEITTSPYAHPILPLIYDVQLALVGNPTAEMPARAFAYPQDAEKHLALSVAMYEELFDREVRGLWPGEGAVAQAIVPMVGDAGFSYMQSGEPVLAKTLGIESFTRNSQGFVQEADLLYRPYFVGDENGNQIAIFFRDGYLSDNMGFVYKDMTGEEGARDLVRRLEAIQADFVDEGVAGPHIVSIILDGENAWEHYPNDGNDFLHALYQQLSDSEVLQTVTPSEYLRMFPEQRSLDELFPGAWFSPNYDTWIGETEEAVAWDYLAQVREDLAAFETSLVDIEPERLELAFDFMFLAEGSDWFWWFGDDQDSGQDSYFDEGFRNLLAGVYESLGQEVPRFLEVPVIQAMPVQPTRPLRGIATPVIDGEDDLGWKSAAYYQASDDFPVNGFYITLDNDNLYLRVDFGGTQNNSNLSFYLDVPGDVSGYSPFTNESEQMLGFNSNFLMEWDGGATLNILKVEQEKWSLLEAGVGLVEVGDDIMEFSIPLRFLGEISAGDAIKIVLLEEGSGSRLPNSGPAQVIIPDLGEITTILQVQDPVGDDYGPGSYTYPEDAVFKDSVFDVTSFEVGFDDKFLILTFGFVAEVENPWGSPNGLALQTLDVYIDLDPGSGTGARKLLPGRNAALVEGYGWEYAIWAEGWEPRVMQVDQETQEIKPYSEASSAMSIIVDPETKEVIIRVPLSFLPEGDPEEWAYAAMVLGQEGFPSEGVWRVRDVEPTAAQYRFGGGLEDTNHTRIIDLVLPENATWDQASLLSDYPSSQESIDNLGPDDFAQIPMLHPGDE